MRSPLHMEQPAEPLRARIPASGAMHLVASWDGVRWCRASLCEHLIPFIWKTISVCQAQETVRCVLHCEMPELLLCHLTSVPWLA